MDVDIRLALKEKLEHSPDKFLRRLANDSTLPLDSLLELLLPFIDNSNTSPRYLKKGASGAGVILLVADDGIPTVVKFGREDLIKAEFTNFNNNVSGFLSGDAAPSIWRDIEYRDGFASFAYTWAGDHQNVVQIRSAFLLPYLSSEDMSEAIWDLMTQAKKWYRVVPARSARPFETWKWRGETAQQVLDVLRKNGDIPKIKQLVDFVDGTFSWGQRLDQDDFARAARVHGDMNCHNVVLFGRIRRIHARIIDFGTVTTQHSPAYDWAKLERDLKFRALDECVKSPQEFAIELRAIDERLRGDQNIGISDDAAKIARVCDAIRKHYSKLYNNLSSRPQIEYLIFLLYRSLSLLAVRDCVSDRAIAEALIGSCISTHEQILEALDESQFEPAYSHTEATSERHSPQADALQPAAQKKTKHRRALERDIAKMHPLLKTFFRWCLRKNESLLLKAEYFVQYFMLPGLASLYIMIADELWLLGRIMTYTGRIYLLLFSLGLAVAHLIFWLVPVKRRPVALYKVSLYGTMIYSAIIFNWICVGYGLHLFDGDHVRVFWVLLGVSIVISLTCIFVVLPNVLLVSAPLWQKIDLVNGLEIFKERLAHNPDPLNIYDERVQSLRELGRRAKLVCDRYAHLSDHAAGRRLVKDFPDSKYAGISGRASRGVQSSRSGQQTEGQTSQG